MWQHTMHLDLDLPDHDSLCMGGLLQLWSSRPCRTGLKCQAEGHTEACLGFRFRIQDLGSRPGNSTLGPKSCLQCARHSPMLATISFRRTPFSSLVA